MKDVSRRGLLGLLAGAGVAATFGEVGRAEAQTRRQAPPAPSAPPSFDNPVLTEVYTAGEYAMLRYSMGNDGKMTQILNVANARRGNPTGSFVVSELNVGERHAVNVLSRDGGPILIPNSREQIRALEAMESIAERFKQSARTSNRFGYELNNALINAGSAIFHAIAGRNWLGNVITNSGAIILDGMNQRSNLRHRAEAESTFRTISYAIQDVRLDNEVVTRILSQRAQGQVYEQQRNVENNVVDRNLGLSGGRGASAPQQSCVPDRRGVLHCSPTR